MCTIKRKSHVAPVASEVNHPHETDAVHVNAVNNNNGDGKVNGVVKHKIPHWTRATLDTVVWRNVLIVSFIHLLALCLSYLGFSEQLGGWELLIVFTVSYIIYIGIWVTGVHITIGIYVLLKFLGLR